MEVSPVVAVADSKEADSPEVLADVSLLIHRKKASFPAVEVSPAEAALEAVS